MLRVLAMALLFQFGKSLLGSRGLQLARPRQGLRAARVTARQRSQHQQDVLLNNDLGQLKGVGAKTLELLARLDIHSITDLALHFPHSVIDRSKFSQPTPALLGEVVTCEGIVEKVKEGFNGAPCVVQCRDPINNTPFTLTYFFGKGSNSNNFIWMGIKKTFIQGARIVVSGKLSQSTFGQRHLDFINPDFALDANAKQTLSKYLTIEPRYGLTEGVSQSKLRSLVSVALEHLQQQPALLSKAEHLPEEVVRRNKWPSVLEAIVSAHNPSSPESLSELSPWRQRLAFDEFVALQLGQLRRAAAAAAEQISSSSTTNAAAVSHSVVGTGELTSILANNLPFELTSCQKKAVDEIWEQMALPERMIRCVQGDVGSGKTLVAIFAMLRAVEDGKQATLLAPTEILAKQHFDVISKHIEVIGQRLPPGGARAAPKVALLTGSIQGKQRALLLEELRAGTIDIIVGTHALLSDQVAALIRPGLVCIDEEQRFGVSQRDVLGDRTNVIYTTATPIPRSLMMVVQEGYSISTLVEKPPTKRPIQTILVGLSYTDRVIQRIRANIPFGTKVFWVTPSLFPSPTMLGSSAHERYEQLSQQFPGKVALLHGKMTSDEKEKVMARFSARDGDVSILVSTTVVEVGVDVPDASICIIDRAENFGLSQIHQIRGRVGRGEKPEREILNECFCVLLYQDRAEQQVQAQAQAQAQQQEETEEEEQDPLSPKAKLQILARTNDGFEIAESDLKLRGPGDLFGFRQHGEAKYRVASLTAHAHLLGEAMVFAHREHKRSLAATQEEAKRQTEAIYGMFAPRPRSRDEEEQGLEIAEEEEAEAETVSASAAAEEKTRMRTSSVKPSSAVRRFTSIPPNAAVDLTAENVDVVLLDLETTGLKTDTNRIIQVAAAVLGGSASSQNVFNRYVRPASDLPLSAKIVELTGISTAFLEEQGHTTEQALTDLKAWIASLKKEKSGRRLVLVAHNARNFDFKFLSSELSRVDSSAHGASLAQVVGVDALLDSLDIVRHSKAWALSPTGEPQGKSMAALYSHVRGGEQILNAHNALSDVLALEEILESDVLAKTWRSIARELQFE